MLFALERSFWLLATCFGFYCVCFCSMYNYGLDCIDVFPWNNNVYSYIRQITELQRVRCLQCCGYLNNKSYHDAMKIEFIGIRLYSDLVMVLCTIVSQVELWSSLCKVEIIYPSSASQFLLSPSKCPTICDLMIVALQTRVASRAWKLGQHWPIETLLVINLFDWI